MKFQNILLPALTAALLAACGGGGGGSPSTSSTTLSGVVAKGPATGAKVKVYATTANGQRGSLLGEVTSGAGGRYSVSLLPQTTPVLVEVDLDGALIENEATGDTYKGKAGDVMKAVFVPSSAAAQSINVTPFSNLAVSMLAGNYSADQIQAATAVVRQIVGNKDFLTVSPTDDAGLKQQLTQLAARATDGSGGSTLQSLFESLNGAVQKTGNTYAVNTAGYAAALCGTLGSECTQQFADASAILEVTAGPALTASAKAKALVQSLYDTITAFHNAGKTGELDLALSSVASAANDASNVAAPFFDQDQLSLMASANQAVQLIGTGFAGPYYGSQGTICRFGNFSNLSADGTIVDGTSWTEETNASNASVAVCSAWGSVYPQTLSNSTNTKTIALPYLKNQLIVFRQAGGTAKYASRVMVVDATKSEADALKPDNNFTLGGVNAIQYGVITTTENSGSFVGRLAPSAGLIGMYGLNEWKTYDYQDVNLSLTVNTNGTSFVSATIGNNGFIRQVKNGTEVSRLNITTGTLTTTDLNLDVYVQANGVRMQGVLSGKGSLDQSTGAVTPGSLSFTGAVYQGVGGAYTKLLEGVLTASEATATAPRTVGFVGQISLKDRAPFGFSMNGKEAAGALVPTSGTFFWAGNSFTVTPLTAGGYQVANSDGVSFTVPEGISSSTVVPLMVGDLKVGELLNGKVSFVDGSYFQF